MLTTIRELIKRHNLDLNHTVYRWEKDQVLDFPLITGDFFEVVHGMEKGENYSAVCEFYETRRQESEKLGVLELMERMEQNQNQVVEIKKKYKGCEKKKLLEKLGQERRRLREEIDLHMEASYETAVKSYGENRGEFSFFEYKNRVMATSFENIMNMVPVIK